MKDGIGDEVGEACPTIGSVIGTDWCHNEFNSDDDDGDKIHPTYIILLLPEAKVVIINGNFVVAATA